LSWVLKGSTVQPFRRRQFFVIIPTNTRDGNVSHAVSKLTKGYGSIENPNKIVIVPNAGAVI
ncbi:MAG: hypothetical protein AAF329_14175, partial [Cyanobacteria bacterium P01_A01_bin.17]